VKGVGNQYRAGELVEVRSREEVLGSLDSSGALDGLPFMPEMLAYCGRRFRISKVAHKTCDTVTQTGGRSLVETYHLEGLRCDGSSHGGCQADCLLFWKGAWLRRPETHSHVSVAPRQSVEETLIAATRRQSDPELYRCQATELLAASDPLPWWDMRQYWRDLSSGNVRPGRFVRVILSRWLQLTAEAGVGYRLLVSLYNRLQRILGGSHFPFGAGRVPAGQATPVADLGIQPGERVFVKTHEEILDTVDADLKNRGMRFDPEMVPYCGGEYTVRKRVDRIINERTGEMMEMKTPCIMLEGVVCRSEYSACRLFCPREIPSYWREIWLQRVEEQAKGEAEDGA